MSMRGSVPTARMMEALGFATHIWPLWGRDCRGCTGGGNASRRRLTRPAPRRSTLSAASGKEGRRFFLQRHHTLRLWL